MTVCDHCMSDRAYRDEALIEMLLWNLLRDVYDEIGCDLWMNARNQMLDGERPKDLISLGEGGRVWQVIDQLRSGLVRMRECPCGWKELALDGGIALWSPEFHRGHRDHHLYVFPGSDDGTRRVLDEQVARAERLAS